MVASSIAPQTLAPVILYFATAQKAEGKQNPLVELKGAPVSWGPWLSAGTEGVWAGADQNSAPFLLICKTSTQPNLQAFLWD